MPPQVADDIDAGPAGGVVSERKFLGVPDDYFVNRSGFELGGNTGDMDRGYYENRPVTPQYRQGDQYTPGTFSPSEIAEMQQDLVRAGLISRGQKFRAGVWDPVTVKAYQTVLETANQQGLGAAEVIDQFINSPMVDLSESKPLQYDLPDPEEVKSVFKKTSRATLGRELSQSEIDAMQETYQQRIMDIQRQNFENAALEGAKMYDAPDAATFSEEAIRQRNPGEAQAHDYSEAYNAFSDLISKSASGVKQF